jgi:VanZ family protein
MSSVTRDSDHLPRYRGAWLALGWGTTLLIALGSLWPSVPQQSFGASDKFIHFGAYACLAFMYAGVVERRYWGRVVLGLLLFGGAIEFAQELLTASRSGEWLDMVANAIGVMAGVFTAMLFPGSWCRQVERLVGLDEGRR